MLFWLGVLGLSNARLAWPPKLPGRQCAEAVQSLTYEPTHIIVDANNVRGATAFRLSKQRLATLCTAWAQRNGLRSRVVVVWDHGQQPTTLEWHGVTHAFAGPRQSADDVIAEQVVPALLTGGCERVCVVTTDRGLIYRMKHEAAESGAAQGRLRLLGTRKFVALLLHGAEDETVAGAAASADSPGAAPAVLPKEYALSDASVRQFASSLRPVRPHERRRQRERASSRASSSGAPYAERTWQRVLMAEKLRRSLAKSSELDGSIPATGRTGERAPSMQTALVEKALDLAAQRRLRRGTPAEIDEIDGPEAMLSDCRLDAKQRALLLRYGAMLSDGSLLQQRQQQQRRQQQRQQRGEGEPNTTPVMVRRRPTHRERRVEQKLARAARASAASAGEGAGARVATTSAPSRADESAWVRREQMAGLARWLDDDPSLYALDEERETPSLHGVEEADVGGEEADAEPTGDDEAAASDELGTRAVRPSRARNSAPNKVSRTDQPRLCLADLADPPDDLVPLSGSAQATASGAAVPVGLHPGVLCDVTMMPITGYRYTDGQGYDLCQAAFDELPAVEQRRFERLDPPLTPRRAVVASVASVLLGSQLGALSLRATSFTSRGGRGEREDEVDLWELQPLSPAEELVAAIFRPAAQATL